MATSNISYLFVPASRPDRFEKALRSAADAVIVDLEDAVANEDKESALESLVGAVSDGLSRPVHVRINAADSPWFDRDLAALAQLSAPARSHIAGVVLPKTERCADLQRVRAVLDDRADMVALIESAVGVSRARELAGTAGLTRFAVGAADLSFDLDADIESTTIDWVYALLVVESRLAGVSAPIGSPSFEIQDVGSIEREAIRLRSMGATAQLCIHPAQIAPVHNGFLPSAEQMKWAEQVVTAAQGNEGAVQVGGQMVDKPVRERAERVLAQVVGRR